MTINSPVGWDGGDPGVISGRADTIISGGQPVGISGAVDVVNASGVISFNPDADIVFSVAVAYASGAAFVGLATQTVASGAVISVATKGAFIVRAADTVTVSQDVASTGDADGFVTSATAGQKAGRALTGATSGAHFVMLLR